MSPALQCEEFHAARSQLDDTQASDRASAHKDDFNLFFKLIFDILHTNMYSVYP